MTTKNMKMVDILLCFVILEIPSREIKFVKRLLTFGMVVGKGEMFPLSWQGYSVVYCLSLGFHIHNLTC